MAELKIVLPSCLHDASFIKLEFSTAFDHSLISVTVEHGSFHTGPVLDDRAPRCDMYPLSMPRPITCRLDDPWPHGW